MDARPLPDQFLSNGVDIKSIERFASTQRYRRRRPSTLTAYCTAHHIAHRGMGYLIAANGPAGDEQIADAFGYE